MSSKATVKVFVIGGGRLYRGCEIGIIDIEVNRRVGKVSSNTTVSPKLAAMQ